MGYFCFPELFVLNVDIIDNFGMSDPECQKPVIKCCFELKK